MYSDKNNTKINESQLSFTESLGSARRERKPKTQETSPKWQAFRICQPAVVAAVVVVPLVVVLAIEGVEIPPLSS